MSIVIAFCQLLPMGRCILNLYLSNHFSAELEINDISQNISSYMTLAVNMSTIKPLISSLFLSRNITNHYKYGNNTLKNISLISNELYLDLDCGHQNSSCLAMLKIPELKSFYTAGRVYVV